MLEALEFRTRRAEQRLALKFEIGNPNDIDFARGSAAQVFRGEAAMTLMGSWLIGYYAGPEYDWREGEDFGFFPFPEIDARVPRVALEDRVRIEEIDDRFRRIALL